jgi:uncharacterized membrane protein YqjE
VDRLSTTAGIAVRQFGAYTDLIRDDLAVQSRLVRQRLLLGATALIAAQLVLVLLCGLVLALSWETPYRIAVLAGLLLVFLLAAAAALWRMRALDAQAPSVLQKTADEWAKDRRVLEELLARQQGRAG